MKEKYDHKLLLKHLPSDLNKFLEHIQSLGYIDLPDYSVWGRITDGRVIGSHAFLIDSVVFGVIADAGHNF